jgi:hypothetical protein
MEEDNKIFDECVAELSKESRAELNKMVENIQDNIRLQRIGRRASGLGEQGAKEIIISLIRNGFLPITNTTEALELQRRMNQWGQV